MIRKFIPAILTLSILFSISCASSGPKLVNGKTLYSSPSQSVSSRTSVEGKIIDSKTDKGIKNAIIEFKNINYGVGYYRVTSNTWGNFEIRNFLPQVNYSIEVVAKGYVSYKSKGRVTDSEYNIRLQPESRISGVVTDSKGRPVVNAEVRIKKAYSYYNRRRIEPRIVRTDSTGKYLVEKLPYGRYEATFTKAGYIIETARIKNVKEGETFSLPMRLYKPSAISGKVLVRGLKVPVPDVQISLSGKFYQGTSSFHDGSFRLDDLKPGTYTIRLSHQGFYSPKKEYITIREGESLELQDHLLTIKSPEIKLSSYRYTFTPGDSVSFNLRTFRLDKITATLYKVPVGFFMDSQRNPNAISPKREGFSKQLSWVEAVKDFKPYRWRYQTLQIKDSLKTGGYCLEVKGASGKATRKFFSVTTVGVIMKRSPQRVFAYVSNLKTNKPIPNARVLIYDTSKKKRSRRRGRRSYNPNKSRFEELPARILLKGKTNGKGIFVSKTRLKAHFAALVFDSTGSYAICNTGAPTAFQREKTKFFVYTDRPVYRTGNKVNYKIVCKEQSKKFIPVSDRRIYYRIKNTNRNITIKEGWVKLDSWGTAHGTMTIPGKATLGTYIIQTGFKKKNLYGRGRFYVEQYRKPEFITEITPSQPFYINGDTVEFKVAAKYFFGAPLKHARLSFRIYERTINTSNSRYNSRSSYNRLRLSGDKITGDNGIAVIQYKSREIPFDRELTLETTVTDRSNISITTRKSIKIGRGEFFIRVKPSRRFYSDGATKSVKISTIDHAGKPVSRKVSIKVYRYIWKPWQRVYVHEKRPVFTATVTTNSKGFARLTLPKKFPAYGEFDIIASGRDRRENSIQASRVIWIYGAGYATVKSKFKNLELDLNKQRLKRSQNITCLLRSRYKDAHVLITVEGRDIYSWKVVKMDRNIKPVTLKINSSYAPNCYVSAAMQRKRALYTRNREVILPTKGTRLNVSLVPGKKSYKPGDKATVAIKVTDLNGKPIKADLSLAAVDEAIYNIRPDHTPEISAFFYRKISNWVLTSYSYPITLLAGAGKDSKVKVREKFEDTAFWKANIKTNSKGLATVSFTLPDNLTTWRLTARGHDKKGRMGDMRKKFLVTQDLIARIGKPRFFIEGDTMGLLGLANSNTYKGISRLQTTFKFNNDTLKPKEDKFLSLPPFGSARETYDVRIPSDTKKIPLYYEITSAKSTDALKLTIPVEKRGVPYSLFTLGDMDKNRTVEVTSLKSTDDFRFEPEEMTIRLAPSPIIHLIRSTKFLSKYPYGCIEQTLNKFVPLMILNQLVKFPEYATFSKDKAFYGVNSSVKKGLLRIEQLQGSDGTWGWWSGDRGNAFITSYVMYSLYKAKELGYSVSKNAINRGKRALNRMLEKSSNINSDAAAYVLYVDALWDRLDIKKFEKLGALKKQNAYRLSYLLKAGYAGLEKRIYPGQKKKVREALTKHKKALLALFKKDARGIYWPALKSQRLGWQGSRVEVTAQVLSALAVSGESSTLPQQIMTSLMRRSSGSAWTTTKETAYVLQAMCDYLKRNPSSASMSGAVSFKLNGKSVASINYDLTKKRDTESFERVVPISKSDTAPGYTLTADGTASKDMLFTATLKGTLYFKNRGLLSILKSKEKSLKELSNGISIARSFDKLIRVKDTRNQEYLLPEAIKEKDPLKIGDEILVKVRFSAQDDFQYLILEDYLPAGCEVIKQDAYGGYKNYVHKERRDNRMVYFFSNIRKGKTYEIAYIVRSELPGSFMVRPTRMECMYEPSIQGWTKPFILKVLYKP